MTYSSFYKLVLLVFFKMLSENCIASLPEEIFEVSDTNLLPNSMLLVFPSRGRAGSELLPSISFAYKKIKTVTSFLEKKVSLIPHFL